LPGIFADIVDDEGSTVKSAGAGGYLVIKRPWPSMLRTIWGDNARYLETYWSKFQNRFYVAGDSANRDADGYYWIMGRIDDVLNVAGHRLGTMEIESALVAHPQVAEAAVVGKQHEIKGESVFAYVVLNVPRPNGDDARLLIAKLRDWVGSQLSPIAKPDEIRLTDNLPKTRSGKIMRRLLRSIARGEPITQDVSTLENPAILEQLRGSTEGPTTPTLPPKKTAAKKAASKKAKPATTPRARAAKAQRQRGKRVISQPSAVTKRKKPSAWKKPNKPAKRTKAAAVKKASKPNRPVRARARGKK
jgi:hypothetical protein